MQAADLDGGDGDAGLCAPALAQQADVLLEQSALLVRVRVLIRPPRPVRLHQAVSLFCGGSIRMHVSNICRVTMHQLHLIVHNSASCVQTRSGCSPIIISSYTTWKPMIVLVSGCLQSDGSGGFRPGW